MLTPLLTLCLLHVSSVMPPAAVLRGPPTLCHPIEIGSAASLPWKGSASNKSAFAIDPDYDVARVVGDTIHILDSTSDALVHMETIRRAVIYLAGEGLHEGPGALARPQDITQLLQHLQERSELEDGRIAPAPGTPAPVKGSEPAAAPQPGKSLMPLAFAPSSLAPVALAPAAPAVLAVLGACAARANSGCDAGLCWFDVGYTRAALAQIGVDCVALMAPATAKDSASASAGEGKAAAPPASAAELRRAALEKAAALRPKDGAIQFGVALALFNGDAADERACFEHLDTAVTLADDPDDLLRTNLLATMGKFLGARTHEDLATAVRERRARG